MAPVDSSSGPPAAERLRLPEPTRPGIDSMIPTATPAGARRGPFPEPFKKEPAPSLNTFVLRTLASEYRIRTASPEAASILRFIEARPEMPGPDPLVIEIEVAETAG